MHDKALLDLHTFSDLLSLGADSLHVFFRAGIDASGRVRLDFDPIPLTNESKFILFGWSRDGDDIAHFCLSGLAESGARFNTDSLHFNTLGESSDASGSRMRPKARCSKAAFSLKLSQPAKSPVLRMRMKGFENFSSHHAECGLGRVAIAGQHSFENADMVTGWIAIEANPPPSDAAEWRVKAERLLEHARNIMTLAASSVLRTPVMEYFESDRLEVTATSETVQHPSDFRVIHFLAQETIFETAIRSFFNPPIKINRLYFAIEWLAMEVSYNEERLANAMTALETLIDSNLEESDVYIQPKKTFEKTTRRALRKVIRNCLEKWPAEDSAEVLKELNEKLAELNRRSFLRKLQILAARWGVPLHDISEDRLNAAKQARDKVVHRGQYYEDWREGDADLWTHAVLVREVATRFLFTVIGYKGRYISYLGGYRDAGFPPHGKVDTPQEAFIAALKVDV